MSQRKKELLIDMHLTANGEVVFQIMIPVTALKSLKSISSRITNIYQLVQVVY